MKPEEFVELLYQEKEATMSLYFSADTATQTGDMVKQLVSQGAREDDLKKLIDLVLRETYYTLLLGLEGEAAIGEQQIAYQLYDEDGNKLTGDGLVETKAYELFMENMQ